MYGGRVGSISTARGEECIDNLWKREIFEVVVELDALIAFIYLLLHLDFPLIFSH